MMSRSKYKSYAVEEGIVSGGGVAIVRFSKN